MSYKTTAIIGFVFASVVGCEALHTTPIENRPTAPNSAAHDSAARDAVVLQVVFDDMLSKDNSEAPMEWNGDPSKPVFVSNTIGNWRPKLSDILARHDEKQWNALSNPQLQAATQAADDLIDRVNRRDSLPELRSTSGRLRIYEDAGAATQPTPENPFGERASGVFLPGYSKDGRYALVRLNFPWSMHSGEATYILERTDHGWKVLLRDFAYYV